MPGPVFTVFYDDSTGQPLGASTVQDAIDATKAIAFAALDTGIHSVSQAVKLADLQGAGAVTLAVFPLFSPLPADAIVLGCEQNVRTPFTGPALAAATSTLEASVDTAGSLLLAASALTGGFKAGIGTNPYQTRGGQQLQTTITVAGLVFSALTAGQITYTVFYALVP